MFIWRGVYKFEEILKLATDVDVKEISIFERYIQPDDACNIQFTSGTTGNAKAAILSHYALVNNGAGVANRTGMEENAHRICCQVPLFHVYGVVAAIMGTLAYGTTMVLPAPGYNPDASLHAIIDEKYEPFFILILENYILHFRCTIIYGTPTMYVDLVARQKQLKLKLSTAEIAVTGGAPCSPQLFQDIKNVLDLRCVKVSCVDGRSNELDTNRKSNKKKLF